MEGMAVENALEQIALDWAVRCFTQAQVYDRPTRALRILEEAHELAQALYVTEAEAEVVLRTVHSRPRGEPRQELGGVMLTTSVMCASMGFTTQDVLLMELRRVLAKSTEHFQQRNKEKLDLGLGRK